MVNVIRTIYPSGSNKGFVQRSVLAPEFNVKHLKKAEGRISRNDGHITTKMNTLNDKKIVLI